MSTRTDHVSTTHLSNTRETYSLGGLLTYTAVIPAFVALLAVPGIVLAFTLGALTAVLLNRALGLV
jgi:hypothetical protein